ncbi:MAG: isoleucine--tRNA ligase [Actinomycetota bacterium]|nr:isoleucine--tRNA ligase [Actinomycetota bacterium]
MPFPPVEANVDFVALEEQVLGRWTETRLFEESLRRREGASEWVFYEGPPTANGRPGLHHVWARSFKDLFPRFHTMRGRYVARKGGWDCHGLPVEVEVEKELGLSGKTQIRDYGIEAFNARCRDSVHRYVEEWTTLTDRIGMWLDTDDAYWTLSNGFIESVWWLFRQMWDDGLIYEGFKVVPYCGRCGTAVSSHEVAQGYEDVIEESVYVRFPVIDGEFDLLVWTTTPWTLISNVAAAVGPEIDYVRVRLPEPGVRGVPDGRSRDVVMARARVEAVLGEDAEVVGPVPATDLVGRHYQRPFEFLPVTENDCRVVAADFVTTDDGSGIVHLAPAFGEVDREVGEAEGLSTLNPVDTAARFEEVVTPYAGLFVKDADPAIIEDLRAAGRLLRTERYTHSYPHCWRCGTPLIYYAKTSWFARTQARKTDLVAQNETINWHPGHIKDGRFGDWLENNVDWALSRDRYWGTPLPVWRCTGRSSSGDTPDPGPSSGDASDPRPAHDTCVGSVAELSELSERDLSDLDLHRPFVDAVTFPCPVEGCGAEARRVDPVLDAWFDSGSMPSAQFHYPFAGDEPFKTRFPADFICEAIDQTRGWFYSLLAVNTLVFGSTPYRNVVCLAHVVDIDGQKMSKSRGNVIDPWEILRSRGADALRWYFFSAGSPWTNRRVYEAGIDESVRKFLLTLWNTLSFFVTYANLPASPGATPEAPGGWTAPPAGTPSSPPFSGHVLDHWIRSRLAATTAAMTDALEGYDTLGAAGALEGLVDDLSNWYVRRSRSRFWKAKDNASFATLHHCLMTVSKLLAPFCPFVADEIHRVLAPEGAEPSVHLEDWPEVDAGALDPRLEAEMALARRLVALGRAARGDARLRVRQPLRRAFILIPGGEAISDEVASQVAEELNVKTLEVVTSLEGLIRYSVVPNFRALGPRLGPRLPAVKAALADADGTEVRRSLEEAGHFVVDVDGEAVELGPGDVEVRATEHEELALAKDGPYAVALDLALDDDLRLEGLARELARALNDHRKAIGLAIADRIKVVLSATGPVAQAAERHGRWIAGEVLAVDWEVRPGVRGVPGKADGLAGAILDVDGSPVEVAVERA